MASVLDYILLATDVYYDSSDPKIAASTEWTPLDGSVPGAMNTPLPAGWEGESFFARAYINSSGTEVVIAYRGMDSLGADLDDVKDAFIVDHITGHATPPEQLYFAHEFFNR